MKIDNTTRLKLLHYKYLLHMMYFRRSTLSLTLPHLCFYRFSIYLRTIASFHMLSYPSTLFYIYFRHDYWFNTAILILQCFMLVDLMHLLKN